MCHREDGSVRADSDRDCQQRCHRKKPIAAKLTHAVDNVLKDVLYEHGSITTFWHEGY